MTVFVKTDYEHAAQVEATYNTSPGALAGTDFFRCQSAFMFKRVQARYDRDQDSDNSASVLTTQRGRESCTFEVTGDIIPSGVTGTPTEPDMDQFYLTHFGQKHKCTAHTTTTAGSAGTSLVLVGGGGAASGIAAGDLIAVDVSSTFGVEVRRVISIATDTVTVNAAFSANPASGRAVYTGTTYRFLKTSTSVSVFLWSFLSGNNFRESAGGCIPRQLKVDIDFTQDTPVASQTFSGEGANITTHATSKPTPTLAGLPLLPSESKFFFGATKQCLTALGLESDNGNELRQDESCSLFPTGVKRTGNNGRYNVKLTCSFLRDSTTHEGYFDNADILQTYDVIGQMGVAVGNIFAVAAPDFVPDAEVTELEGEVGVTLSGRCYGTTADDEIYVAFI